ncbi:hypothetical protein AB1L07_02445 [Niallia alba]|uniref:hypothetical protein n=1 Tax=Niallia alba TaxID=2729105 RepID=UPI0039A30320
MLILHVRNMMRRKGDDFILYQIGILLLIWLTTGCTIGLKIIYYDKRFSEESFNKYLSKANLNPEDEFYFNFVFGSKLTFLSICTLLGLITLFADILGTVKSIKK